MDEGFTPQEIRAVMGGNALRLIRAGFRNPNALKLLYGAQVQTRPPRFRITVNDRKLITADYAYYLENRIREAAHLEGCPAIIDLITR